MGNGDLVVEGGDLMGFEFFYRGPWACMRCEPVESLQRE